MGTKGGEKYVAFPVKLVSKNFAKILREILLEIYLEFKKFISHLIKTFFSCVKDYYAIYSQANFILSAVLSNFIFLVFRNLQKNHGSCSKCIKKVFFVRFLCQLFANIESI